MDVYLKNTMPIIEYYKAQKKLKTVDGDEDSESLYENLMRLFNEN